MKDDTQITPTDAAQTPDSRPPRFFARIFFGKQGLHAGWRMLIFIALNLLLDTGIHTALSRFIALQPTEPTPPGLAFLQESCALLVVLFTTWLMGRIEKRSPISFGYEAENKITRLLSGAVWGFICLSVLIGVIWKAGFLVFEGQLLHGLNAWRYAFVWALIFLVVGLVEESLLRGYLQFTLSRSIGFWWAAFLLSITFALLHVGNGGESLLGLLSVCAGGFVFCLSLWYTRSLWWAIGFHAGWDWGQSYFYGTPDSGMVMKGHLLAEHPSGRVLWSGGTVGPEGSLFLFPLLIVLAFGMWVWWGFLPRLHNTKAHHSQPS